MALSSNFWFCQIASLVLFGQHTFATIPVVKLFQNDKIGDGSVVLNLSNFQPNDKSGGAYDGACAWDVCTGLHNNITFDNGDPVWGKGEHAGCGSGGGSSSCVGWFEVISSTYSVITGRECAIAYGYAPDKVGFNYTEINASFGKIASSFTYMQIVGLNGSCTVPVQKHAGTGVGAGGAFVIAFVAVAFTYIFGGIVYNRRRGADGMQLLPNVDFWMATGSLIKDGCSFFWWTIIRRKPHQSSAYTEL
eukprot:m.60912 g.60912  ORF g.60912 m.60912 type:complete len:248 (+) comp15740_c1_seq1:733-1476(+)